MEETKTLTVEMLKKVMDMIPSKIILVSPRTMEAVLPMLKKEGIDPSLIEVDPYLPDDMKAYVIDRRKVVDYLASPNFRSER